MINQLRIRGALQMVGMGDTGTLSTMGKALSGSTSLPKIIEQSAIHYDTTEGWNSSRDLVAERGHLYIYSDYETVENEDGSVTKIPGLKVGDGTSYLIDMPFVVTGISGRELDEHINNMAMHVSTEDRDSWNEKVKTEVQGENLVFISE